MFTVMLGLFTRPRFRYVWRSKDFDIPVEFLGSAGSLDGKEFAKVKYDDKVSFVPMDELYYERF